MFTVASSLGLEVAPADMTRGAVAIRMYTADKVEDTHISTDLGVHIIKNARSLYSTDAIFAKRDSPQVSHNGRFLVRADVSYAQLTKKDRKQSARGTTCADDRIGSLESLSRVHVVIVVQSRTDGLRSPERVVKRMYLEILSPKQPDFPTVATTSLLVASPPPPLHPSCVGLCHVYFKVCAIATAGACNDSEINLVAYQGQNQER